jgi:hypothetical protein
MRSSTLRLLVFLSLFCVAMGTAAPLRAGENADPKAIILKAIQAMGGEEHLARYKANVTKGKCTYYGMGRPIACTGEWYVQLPRQLKAVYQMDMGGKSDAHRSHQQGQGMDCHGGQTASPATRAAGRDL